MIMKRALGFLLGCLIATGQGAMAENTKYSLIPFSDLQGWETDNHARALAVFLETCGDMKGREWEAICQVAARQPNAKLFFETFFHPVMIDDGRDALFTGYYEPELNGSRQKSDLYSTPLYALPPELISGQVWRSRKEIETSQILSGRNLELAWVDDPVAAFFLQVQGSGRVRLDDGSMMRLGYAGKNGHQYRSIGAELIRRGEMAEHEVSAGRIADWVKANPEKGRELLWHNKSFVFFRRVDQVPADKGPLGAMNRSITRLRSIAVDPEFTKLGAPVWIEKDGDVPLNRLMIAQDTGSAIKGAQRVDVFFGTGTGAGQDAGKTRDPGRVIQFLPVQHAFSLVSEK